MGFKRVKPLLKPLMSFKITERFTHLRFVVEIRNKAWLDKRLTDLLGEYNVALALTDLTNMPRPWEVTDGLDLVTTDFVYVKWLGDRHPSLRIPANSTNE
jgi:Protein of unknown function DUF72